MELEQAAAALDRGLERIAELRKLNPGSALFTQVVQSTGLDLARIFGADSPISRNFSAIDYFAVDNFISNAFVRLPAGRWAHT